MSVQDNKNKIKTKRDIALETYDNNEFNSEVLKFIFKINKDDLISSALIKRFIKNNNNKLLTIIFNNMNFYNDEFIKELLFKYKNKQGISKENLKHHISNNKFKIKAMKGIKNNTEFLNQVILDKKKHLIQYLIVHGININKANYLYETPLFHACRSGNKELVEYFVEHGLNINKEDYYGSTPFFDACLNGNKDLVLYLIKHGSDLNKEDNSGKTPSLMHALVEIKI